MWAADLKQVCLEIDVEENGNGSRRILRGGHDFSDRLEESVEFKIPHGYCVAIGIRMELEHLKDKLRMDRALEIFSAFGIPTTRNEYWHYAYENANESGIGLQNHIVHEQPLCA
jgi:3-dehydroquinate synthetase